MGTGVEVAGEPSCEASSLLSNVLMRMSAGCFVAEFTAWKPRPIAGEGDFVCTLSPSAPTAWRAADVTAKDYQLSAP